MMLIRLVKFLSVLLLLVNLFLWVRPFALLALSVVNRSSACPISRVLQLIREDRHCYQVRDRIRQTSRLIKEDPAGFHLWDTPKGPVWIPADSDRLVAALLAEQELKIYGTGATGVHPNDVVLDCGAHVGLYTREALAAGARLVVAIEPAPGNLECLRRNLAGAIAAGHVVVCPKGVWDRDDYLALSRAPGNSGADRVLADQAPTQEWPEVPLITIDRLVDELKLERVDFIKMDIEGAEQRALSGARDTLARYKPRLAIAGYHRRDDPAKLPALISQAWGGYQMECGLCSEENGRIRPEVLFFH